MPASHARAALPGWRRAWLRAAASFAAALTLALAPAQDAPAPRAGAAARPNAGAAGTPGLAPLQTEPGDIWAEVRGWSQGLGPPQGEAGAGAAEAGRRRRIRPKVRPPKPRRAAPCTAETPGCTRRPARPPANPG